MALAGIAAGCAASDPPPTNPLDETSTGTTMTGGTPRPLPTFPASGTVTVTPSDGSTPSPDAAAQAEHVTGEAISRLAEWTGVPETDLRLTAIERVEWPDACIGIANPAVACAEVITPGYRVTLHHVNAPDVPYLVHANETGRYAWAPLFGPEERTVAGVDAAAGTVTLERIEGGTDAMGTLHRVAPGSTLEVPLAALQPGQRVVIGTAPAVDGAREGLIVLLAPVVP